MVFEVLWDVASGNSNLSFFLQSELSVFASIYVVQGSDYNWVLNFITCLLSSFKLQAGFKVKLFWDLGVEVSSFGFLPLF